MPPPAKGTRKHAAPTKLHKALVRGVMRGGGGTKGRAVLIMPLNEHRTTKCCSRCGGETGAAKVEWRGEVRDSNRWRECAACKRGEQEGEGEEGGEGEGERTWILVAEIRPWDSAGHFVLCSEMLVACRRPL